MKYCSKCGSPINDDMAFCMNCGEKTLNAEQLKKAKKKTRSIIIAACIVLLIATGILLYLTLGSAKSALPKGIKWGDSYSDIAAVDEMVSDGYVNSDGDVDILRDRDASFLGLSNEIKIDWMTYYLAPNDFLGSIYVRFDTNKEDEIQEIVNYYSNLYPVKYEVSFATNGTLYTWETRTECAYIFLYGYNGKCDYVEAWFSVR